MVTKKEIRKYYGIFKSSQIELANRLNNYFTNSIHVENEFLYVPGDSKVCVVAHLDTVHNELPQRIIEASVPNGTKVTSENGIGADDRCGIIASLVLYNGLQEKPHLLFTYDEEIGGKGVKKFVNNDIYVDLQSSLNCFIQFDRKGKNDYIDYGYVSNDLQRIFESEGFKRNNGSYSDVSTLAAFGNVAAVNLSIGYYKQHTKSEYFIEEEMLSSINRFIEVYPQLQHQPFTIDRINSELSYDFEDIDVDYSYFNHIDFLAHDLKLWNQGYLIDDYFYISYGYSPEELTLDYYQYTLFDISQEELYVHDMQNVNMGYLDFDYIQKNYNFTKEIYNEL